MLILEELKSNIQGRIDISREIPENELMEAIESSISEVENYRHECFSIRNRERYRKQLYNSIRQFDILQELLDDADITEIMVNGIRDIFYEKSGQLFKWNREFDSQKTLEDLAQRIAAGSNKTVNQAHPIVDTRLKDGSRVNIVLPPAAIDGPVITIRKFFAEMITLEKLIEMESITIEAAEFLKAAVKARLNLFVSGGTGSGKTTMLNVLSNFIGDNERVVTIEDAAELQIREVPNLVRLETRKANLEGDYEITIRDLIKSSLRMRPDRIIVGEIRGAEAIDMLQAMNTGHDGSLSTGHANSPLDMLHRIETMVLMGIEIPLEAVRGQIASAIDVVIHLGRQSDKSRKVEQIVEIGELEDGNYVQNILFQLEEGRLVKKNCLRYCKKSVIL